MGWTSFFDNRELSTGEICTREFTDTNPAGDRWSVVDQSTRGSVWYAIGRLDRVDQPPVFYGLVWLTSRKNGQFGYKSMTDCMGPYRWDMPKRLLDQLDQLAPNAPQTALDWRAKCREKLAEKRKPKLKLAPGQIVTFPRVTGQFELIMPIGPRRGWSVRYLGGSMSYTVNARQIANCQIIGGQNV
jgi:hypothetical protein